MTFKKTTFLISLLYIISVFPLMLLASTAPEFNFKLNSDLFSGTTFEENDLKKLSFDTVLNDLKPNPEQIHIIFLGEEHNNPIHAQHQNQIIQEMQNKNVPVWVGMEFIDFTQQEYLDNYRSGQMSEDAFLKAIQWQGFDFANYKYQILASRSNYNENCVALNSPRWLTGKVAKMGLSSLTESEKSFLPTGFTLGRDSYKQRFSEVMGGHVPAEKMEKYFAAQSIWDDTMAFQVVKTIQKMPKGSVLMVVVGEFHTQYGGGFPDRLKQRLMTLDRLQNGIGYDDIQIKTLSFLDQLGMDLETKKQQNWPSEKWGARADYLWLIND